ncbi:MAG TPA: hypothetical protein PKO03_08015, partial [Anaerolineaceae bacterium]|nr:hypothetical protein [Anaerolineaceae bacterium]
LPAATRTRTPRPVTRTPTPAVARSATPKPGGTATPTLSGYPGPVVTYTLKPTITITGTLLAAPTQPAYPGLETPGDALTGTPNSGGYPVGGSPTPGGIAGSSPTPTPTSEGPTEQRPLWWVPLLIILTGLALLGGLGYYLWSRGLLPLPLLTKRKQPPSEPPAPLAEAPTEAPPAESGEAPQPPPPPEDQP